MNTLALALLLASAVPAVASAQAAVIGPLPAPPAQTNQTASLIFDAMLAVARASQANPQSAQAAALSYRQAVQRYQSGDIEAARAAALQALFNANRAQANTPLVVLTPLPLPNYGTAPVRAFPIAGSVTQIDADAFVAQARSAVAACAAAHARNTNAAQAQLAAAERADKAGNVTATRAAAKAAIDLCADTRR